MNKPRTVLLAVILVLTLAVTTACGGNSSAAGEDNYPEREIRMIVPYSAGGTMDTAARQIQMAFADQLGKPIVIENRDGAGGQLGLTLAYKEKQDGYVIAGMPSPHLEFMLALNDPEFELDDLAFIGGFTSDIDCIRVHKDAPWDTLQDMIDDARQRPGEISFGVSSINSDNYLGIKIIEEACGVEFNTIDFGGGNPARIALVGGKVDAVHTNIFSSLHIQDDSKVLAIQWDSNPYPDITDNAPTVNEALGIDVAPLSTGTFFLTTKEFKDNYPQRYNKLVEAFKEAVEDDEFIQMMTDIGEYEKVVYTTPEEVEAALRVTLDAVEDYRYLWE